MTWMSAASFRHGNVLDDAEAAATELSEQLEASHDAAGPKHPRPRTR